MRGQVAAVPRLEGVRLTVPAREALIEAGNAVTRASDLQWHLDLTAPPKGLVSVLTRIGADFIRGLRLATEPAYPTEYDQSWWERGEVVPCPRCGRSLVWYEAGYVPGYRICLVGHGAQLSADGTSAKSTWRTHNPRREYGQ